MPRAPLHGEATVYLANDRMTCRIVNVGVGGIELCGPSAAAVGQYMRVNFELQRGMGWLDLDGVLVRQERRGHEFVWGVEFHVLQSTHSVRLLEYVRLWEAQVARKKREAEVATCADTITRSSAGMELGRTREGQLRALYRLAVEELRGAKRR